MLRKFSSSTSSAQLATAVATTATFARFFHNMPRGGGGGRGRGGRGGGGGRQFQQGNFDDEYGMPPQQQMRGGGRGGGGNMMPPRRGGGGQRQFEEDFDRMPQVPRGMPPQQGGGGRQMHEMEEREMMMMQQQRQQQQMMQQQQQMQQQQRGGGMMQQQRGGGGAPNEDFGDYEDLSTEQQMEAGGEDADDMREPPPPPTKPETSEFVTVEEQDGIAIVRLNNKPVNSLSLKLLQELNAWLLWYGASADIKAVVLSSNIPLVFSAGLDLTEFVDCTSESFKTYWRVFQETYIIMHTFPRPLVAAITGNSPAGGCVISLCCDYRIMAKNPEDKPEKPFRIGLNETKLGIVAPPWVMQSCAYVIGQRKAERMLTLGETPTAAEAEKLGLVDLACDNVQDVVPAAVKEAQNMAKVAEEARWMTKDMMRRPLVELFASQEDREYDADFFASLVTAEPVQKSLKDYMGKLKKK